MPKRSPLTKYARKVARSQKGEGKGMRKVARSAVKMSRSLKPSVGKVTGREARVARRLGAITALNTTTKEGRGVTRRARKRAKRS